MSAGSGASCSCGRFLADIPLLFTQRARVSEPQRQRVEDALEQLGFPWERLEKLARGALHDRMRARRIRLDDDRYQRAWEFYVEVGARWALEYDAARAGGVSFASSCYRRMYPRLTDFLRQEHGDQRRGTPLFQIPSERMPDSPPVEHENALSFENAVDALATRLPERARWTLEQLGRPIAEEDLSLAGAAARAAVTVEYASDLLEELGWRLGHTPTVEAGAEKAFALMQEWSA